MVPAWAGVGMHGGTATGDGKLFIRDKVAFYGRNNSHAVKELLEMLLKMKGISFPASMRPANCCVIFGVRMKIVQVKHGKFQK